ncbi:TPA: baseplate hub protein [Salmonella enterica subsp. enterica serovar Muenchen]
MSYVQRDITVEFTLSDGRTFDNGKGNILTIPGAKCFATVTVYGGTAGTQITLYVWGLSPAHMADLSYRGVWRPAQSTANKMRVKADGRLIFEGDITDAYADYNQAPDIPLILTGQVSFNLRNQTAADFSAKGDVPVADIIRALASSAGLKFENQGVSRSLSNPHFSGNLVQQMLDAASAADINIDLGDVEKVTIWPKDKALDIPAVHISPDHGLIGYPVYTMTGLSATTIFCPDLFIGRRVHLESSLPNVTGDYQLTGVIHTITSRTVGGPWSSNCTMTRLNDNGTTTQ